MKIRFVLLLCLVLAPAGGSVQAQDQTGPEARPNGNEQSGTKDAAGKSPSGKAKSSPIPPQVSSFIKSIQIGGLWYLSYQEGREYAGVPDVTQDYNRFLIKRGYLNVTAQLQPWLEARFTPDTTQETNGDLQLRMKYIYAKFKAEGNSVITKPYAEFGLVHMPWLDFEEHVNRFRMQGTMFLERQGLFNSADFGLLLGSDFGPQLSEEYRREVDDHYAGRYGSWQFGVFDGGGYHARENNTNKVVEGRGTLRPLPDAIPGLQFSLFGIAGKGNRTESDLVPRIPDFNVLSGMVSYEQKWVVLTGQWYTGEGSAAGTAVLSDGYTATNQSGFSYFTEVRFTQKRNLSAIVRWDHFNPNTDDPESDLTDRAIMGFAWQMFRGNYWLLDYERIVHKSPSIPDEWQIQLTLQVSF